MKILLLAVLSLNAARAETTLPVRWTKSGDLADVENISQVAAALKQDVLPNGEAGVELERNLPNQLPEKRMATNCVDYADLKTQGFGPQSGFDIAQESFFRSRCSALEFLAKAKPSKQTNFPRYAFSRDSLDDFPPCLGGIAGDSSQRAVLDLALSLGRSWAQFDPGKKVSATKTNSMVFGDAVEEVSFDFTAWGDINDDGLEDVFLRVATHAKRGSFRAFDEFVLSRFKGNGMFNVLRTPAVGACERVAW